MYKNRLDEGLPGKGSVTHNIILRWFLTCTSHFPELIYLGILTWMNTVYGEDDAPTYGSSDRSFIVLQAWRTSCHRSSFQPVLSWFLSSWLFGFEFALILTLPFLQIQKGKHAFGLMCAFLVIQERNKRCCECSHCNGKSMKIE